MLGGAGPVSHNLVELISRHARMGGGNEFEKALFTGGSQRLQITFKDGLVRLRRLPLRMLWGQRVEAIGYERELEVDRLLSPQRPVVVEGGDAFRHGHELLPAGRGHTPDK